MLRRNLVLSLASMPILLPQVKAAGVESFAQALIDIDPEAQQALKNQKKLQEDFFRAYEARIQQEAAKVKAQNKFYYDRAKNWTALNTETPKNGLEFAAQSLRFQYSQRDINEEQKKLASVIPSTVRNLFSDYSPAFPLKNITVEGVKSTISLAKDLLFTPRSKAGSLEKVFAIGWDEYFEIWKAYPKTIDLCTAEYVENHYHPSCTTSIYTICQQSIRLYLIFDSEYKKYVERFNKDPLNKIRKNKPLNFPDYVGTISKLETVTSEPWLAFKAKFSKEILEKTEKNIIDYATMKSLKLEIPKEVEAYLNS